MLTRGTDSANGGAAPRALRAAGSRENVARAGALGVWM